MFNELIIDYIWEYNSPIKYKGYRIKYNGFNRAEKAIDTGWIKYFDYSKKEAIAKFRREYDLTGYKTSFYDFTHEYRKEVC